MKLGTRGVVRWGLLASRGGRKICLVIIIILLALVVIFILRNHSELTGLVDFMTFRRLLAALRNLIEELRVVSCLLLIHLETWFVEATCKPGVSFPGGHRCFWSLSLHAFITLCPRFDATEVRNTIVTFGLLLVLRILIRITLETARVSNRLELAVQPVLNEETVQVGAHFSVGDFVRAEAKGQIFLFGYELKVIVNHGGFLLLELFCDRI